MAASGEVRVSRLPDATVLVSVEGRWRLGRGLPVPDAFAAALDGPPVARRVAFDVARLVAWDTSLLVLVERVLDRCRQRGVAVDTTSLPDGLRRLLALSEAVTGQRPPPAPAPPRWIERLGGRAIDRFEALRGLLAFLGELAFSLGRLVSGRARVRKLDLLVEIEAAGVSSLSIVAVVSFLLGMILAFVGNVTLKPFGAAIYVANVVTIAMVRELGPVMTAIVMAGRNGSAYAAQLGTMKVTQEIDALTTMALPPSDFLVLPRVLALSLMMPLLAVYANFIGVVGGGLVAIAGGSSLAEYTHQAKSAIGLTTFWVGFAKSLVFGVIVAVCGCIQGLRATRGAAAVGDAATSAVVASIVWIIAVDGLFAVVLNVLKNLMAGRPQITVEGLTLAYGSFVVMRDLSFTVDESAIFFIMGGSGSGKSTVLRALIGLQPPSAGAIYYGGEDFLGQDDTQRALTLRRFGVLYQSSGLFSSMTVAENVGLPLGEFTDLSPAEIAEVASLKLSLVGLAGFEEFSPGQLSGGMQKRAGLARAMALDPEILFLDEPSAGLDPISSRRLDELILELRDSLRTTFVIVSHELSSILAIGDASIFLDPTVRTISASGPPRELLAHPPHERVHEFLTRGGSLAPGGATRG